MGLVNTLGGGGGGIINGAGGWDMKSWWELDDLSVVLSFLCNCSPSDSVELLLQRCTSNFFSLSPLFPGVAIFLFLPPSISATLQFSTDSSLLTICSPEPFVSLRFGSETLYFFFFVTVLISSTIVFSRPSRSREMYLVLISFFSTRKYSPTFNEELELEPLDDESEEC
ncbi:unnamed protein product [Haemonchus placei]|uniref:Uncharacterized protein n=1 Tax=Haemonchus placei TaxID=6290 RepID=A0A3P7X516_HAEPC|nr:unnamed protein product [Haemonchus placei]